MEIAGVEPKLIAAGDDVCCFVETKDVHKFVDVVWSYTHNVNENV